MTDKIVNYTDKMTAEIVEFYKTERGHTDNKTVVEKLAEMTGKTTRSIVAKLSREGVYIKAERVTKTGAAVITKAQLVAKIADKVGADKGAFDSLAKATKADLNALINAMG